MVDAFTRADFQIPHSDMTLMVYRQAYHAHECAGLNEVQS